MSPLIHSYWYLTSQSFLVSAIINFCSKGFLRCLNTLHFFAAQKNLLALSVSSLLSSLMFWFSTCPFLSCWHSASGSLCPCWSQHHKQRGPEILETCGKCSSPRVSASIFHPSWGFLIMDETGLLYLALFSNLAKVGLALSLLSKLFLHKRQNRKAIKDPRNKLNCRKSTVISLKSPS